MGGDNGKVGRDRAKAGWRVSQRSGWYAQSRDEGVGISLRCRCQVVQAPGGSHPPPRCRCRNEAGVRGCVACCGPTTQHISPPPQQGSGC